MAHLVKRLAMCIVYGAGAAASAPRRIMLMSSPVLKVSNTAAGKTCKQEELPPNL